MSLIEIKKVESKKDLKTFIDFHYDLYEGNEYDVPNLFSDEMNTPSKDKNAAFEFCEAEYYLAYKDGKLAGRVAAIINHKANNKWGKKSVRFGWIDFIDDREVSKALFGCCGEIWPRERHGGCGRSAWIYRYGPRGNARMGIRSARNHANHLQLPLLSGAHRGSGGF